MANVVGNYGNVATTDAGSKSFTDITIPAAATAALICFGFYTGDAISSVTLDGQSATLIQQRTDNGNNDFSQFYVSGFSTGASKTLAWTLGASATQGVAVHIVFLSDVDVLNLVKDSKNQQNVGTGVTATTAALTLAASGDLCISQCTCDSITSFGSGQTQIGTTAGPGADGFTRTASTQETLASSSETQSVTGDYVTIASVAVTTAPTGYYVQGNQTDAGAPLSANLAFSADVTAGNTIIALVRVGSLTATATVTDSQGNTYTQDASRQQTEDAGTVYVFSAHNVAGGPTTVTVTLSSAVTLRFNIHEYKGDFVLDKTAGAQGTSSTPNSGSTATTTDANELVLGVGYTANARTYTPGSGFTGRVANISGKLRGEDKLVSATGAYSADFVLSLSDTWAMLVATYKAPAGGGGVDLVKVISETEQLSEAVVRALVLARSIAETEQVSEAVLTVRTLARTIAETEQLSEGSIAALTIVRSIAEVLQFAEGTLSVRTLVRAVAESVSISESIARAIALVRSQAETVQVSEAVVDVLATLIIKIIAETVQTSENIVDVLASTVVKVIAETIQFAESGLVARVLTRAIAETVDQSEAIVRSLALTRITEETEQLGEAVAVARALIQILAETEQVGETPLFVRTLVKVVADTWQISESSAYSFLAPAIGFLVGVVKVVDALDGSVTVVDALKGTVEVKSE